MIVLAFIVIAFMMIGYVILDGYDLGIGSITPAVARTDDEREASMRSIGPFWNGNEVWIIAGGGALFALFPQAYASSFSGFYLPFMVVLWLLMFRGISLELRGHYPSEMWHNFWDTCFAGASFLLTLLLGVALGNLVRGLPLDAHGYFQGTFAYLLNPYAILVGIFAITTLAAHGATFLILRLDGPPATRAKPLLSALWSVNLVLFLLVSIITYAMRHVTLPVWIDVLPVIALASLVWMRIEMQYSQLRTFIASSAFIAILLITAAATMFPYLLPAYPAGSGGLSIYDAAPSPVALGSALGVGIFAIVAVLIYGSYTLMQMAGKIRVGE